MPKYSALFQNDEAYSLSLISAFLELNGLDALEWEPETIRLEVKGDFGVDPSQLTMDKLQAAITLMSTDQIYTYWEPLEEVIHVLNGKEADFEIMRPPTPEEIAWGFTEAQLIHPLEEPLSEAVSAEVKAYIATILKQAGLYTAPEVLSFVDMSKWCCDPKEEFKSLSEEIGDLQKVKELRIRAYASMRYEALNAEAQQYFARTLPYPSFSSFLSRHPAWK